MGIAETIATAGISAGAVGTAVGTGLRAFFAVGVDNRIKAGLEAAKVAWFEEVQRRIDARAEALRRDLQIEFGIAAAQQEARAAGRTGSFHSIPDIETMRRDVEGAKMASTEAVRRVGELSERMDDEARDLRTFRETVLVKLGILGERIGVYLDSKKPGGGGTNGRTDRGSSG